MALDQHGRLERILIGVVLLQFLALVTIPLCAIPLHVSRNYDEGWNAYFAQIAMHGGVLYPPIDAMVANNYPPLSFYLVGAVGKMVGDNVVAGRLLSVLSLIVVSINVGRLSRWLGAGRSLAVLASALFLLGVYTLIPGYMATDDPQFLAHAFVTWGALIFLKANAERLWKSMLLSALLIVVGGLIKHNVISLPLTLCTWALFYDRRRLGVFLAASFVVGVAACIMVYMSWGMAMVRDVLFNPRLVWLGRALLTMEYVLRFLLPYLIMTIVGWVLLGRRDKASFVVLYLASSMLNGFWMLAGAGVNLNMLCDAVIALTLGVVLFVQALSDDGWPVRMLHGHAKTVACLLVVLPWMAASLFVYISRPGTHNVDALVHAHQWEELSRTLSLSKGEVACETLAVCYWAHKPMEIDFFNYGQKLYARSAYADAPAGFLVKVTQKSYAYVVIEKSSLSDPRLPLVLMRALFENYKPVEIVADEEVLLVPRT
ncbi:ArnT family glycosyltransferase [Dyella caseinilytica]|uniref:Glycosyltransferase family 39 protein n=1 Tax=Dyella caseinilytica TaxID=1849581 RepID=A0ABX7GVS2_9GAMM|nr:glycosyltransferase family 39 protein [Dyella caseinilytica]QRN54405.1 glycosyltransferase family 39 protein [Dyella caseinilytica]GFZ93968.1 hypothetical protein GCM10011408_12200 [Dyella caseinilytica]